MRKIEENHYLADDGKVFAKKTNGVICGDELFLGYSYYDDLGNKLDEPHLDTIDEYEEIEDADPIDIEDIIF